ncbi:MAG: tetratricopeptide repeat protein [Desulfuromonadales bacterium]
MSKPKVLPTILLTLFLFCQGADSGSAQSIVLTDDVQMTLGNAFIAEKDYYRAITEYKRLIILFPDSARLPEALYWIGMAYYQGKDYTSAAQSFAKVRQTYAADYFSSAAFHEGLCYEKLGRHDAAALAYERARLYDIDHPDAANAHVGLILNAAEQDNIGKTRSELKNFRFNYPQDERSTGIQDAFNLLDAFETQPKKSPALAGTMSAVIPGSGQAYAGNYQDGMMAFLVNGLFIVGTVAAIDNENYALAGIVGGVGLPFYVGNIYGASKAARKWNLSLTHQLRNDLAMTLDFKF